MRKLFLLRYPSTDQGTFGLLVCEGFRCFTSELPWRDNVRQKSCIPTGTYTCTWIRSPRFGPCYQVQNVPNRSAILFHAGNYVGNTDLGFKSHSHGCILLAKKLGAIDGQKAGLISKPAVLELNAFLNKESFTLEIKNA